jgi:hypothetical protein
MWLNHYFMYDDSIRKIYIERTPSILVIEMMYPCSTAGSPGRESSGYEIISDT